MQEGLLPRVQMDGCTSSAALPDVDAMIPETVGLTFPCRDFRQMLIKQGRLFALFYSVTRRNLLSVAGPIGLQN